MSIGNTDEATLWEGSSQTFAAAATGGRGGRRYRITPWHLFYETGFVTTNSQQVPLVGVRDVDVRASMTQKARGVGDIVVHLTNQPEPVIMESIKDAKQVRDIINRAAADARAYHQRQQTTQYHHGIGPAQAPHAQAASAPVAAGGSVLEQLKELAALRDSGVLTAEEFAAQKARILS